jgi:hypothetical protein
VGQAGTKNKGKISRVLAARTSLSARVDALGDKDNTDIGMESRAKVEARLSQVCSFFALVFQLAYLRLELPFIRAIRIAPLTAALQCKHPLPARFVFGSGGIERCTFGTLLMCFIVG